MAASTNSAGRAFRKLRRFLQGRGVNYRRAIVDGAAVATEIAVPGLGPLDELISVLRYDVNAGNIVDVSELNTETEADAVQATLETALAGADNDLKYIAGSEYPGARGNDITVEYVGGASSLSVVVSGDAITVNFVTGSTTASEVLSAVNSHPDAHRVVDVILKTGNDGSGVVITLAPTNLSGGVDADPDNVTLVEHTPVQASIATTDQAADADALYTAQSALPGTRGNGITIEYVADAASSISIEVSDKAITVHTVTLVSTLNDVIAAIAQNDLARALVYVIPDTGNDGSGVIAAGGPYTTVNGADASAGIEIASPDTTGDRLQVDWLSAA